MFRLFKVGPLEWGDIFLTTFYGLYFVYHFTHYKSVSMILWQNHLCVPYNTHQKLSIFAKATIGDSSILMTIFWLPSTARVWIMALLITAFRCTLYQQFKWKNCMSLFIFAEPISWTAWSATSWRRRLPRLPESTHQIASDTPRNPSRPTLFPPRTTHLNSWPPFLTNSSHKFLRVIVVCAVVRCFGAKYKNWVDFTASLFLWGNGPFILGFRRSGVIHT